MTAEGNQGAKERDETGRLLAFSDGVFAIAITLLVLDLKTPSVSHGLLDAVLKQWPAYLSYVFSFVIIGIIWAQHHTIFKQINRTDHAFILLNIVFLMWIAFLPFPTSLLGTYLQSPSERQMAASVYIGTFLFGTIPFNLLWRYAAGGSRLLKEDADRQVVLKTSRSYKVGPVLYLVDFLLSLVSVWASLTLFVLIALFYAVAPLPTVDRFLTSEERALAEGRTTVTRR